MTTNPQAARRLSTISVGEAAAVGVGSMLLLVSLLGFKWLYMPANPAANTPGVAVSFSDLISATDASPSRIQASYFGWLALALFAITVALCIAVLLTGRRLVAAVAAGFVLLTLVLTTLALKGIQTWPQTIAALPNLRFGGYLMLIGLVTLLAYSGFKAVRPPAM